MTRRAIALLLVVVLLLLFPAQGWAPGNCGVFYTYTVNDTVTSSNLNSNFTQAATTNGTFQCLDDYSGTVGQMQSNTDPYASQTESLATTGAGELERLRYVLRNVLGLSQWYIHTENLNFGGIGVTRTGVQGAGLGAHVTAVGLHTWSGSARFPAITSTDRHTTGIFWPAAHHMAISIDRAVDADKTGVEMVRFHAAGIVFHHTAAIMFRHSTGGMNADQYGHVTAIAISRGLVSAAGNEAAGRDTLIFGHAGAVTQIVGYGASHIALGAHSYVALGRHMSAGQPVKNALYADLIPKVWVKYDGTAVGVTVNAAFNIIGITDSATGVAILRFDRQFTSGNSYACVGSGANTVAYFSVAQADSITVTTNTDAGVSTDDAGVMVICLGSQ